MPILIPSAEDITSVATSQSFPTLAGVSFSVERGSNDPYFVADLLISNAVVGSVFWLVDDADHSKILRTGTISSGSMILQNVPALSLSALMLLRLRNSTAQPFYKNFETKVQHLFSGSSTFVTQELDE